MREIMRFYKTVRVFTGALFLLTGAFKLFALGPRSFASALQTLGVPFSQVFGVFVPLLEIIGGLVLVMARPKRGHAVAVAASSALLAVDMLVAILLVGLPGRMGRAWSVGSVRVGQEPWRLPLEIGMLGACVYLFLRAIRDQETPS